MSDVDRIAEVHLERYGSLDPTAATTLGLLGHDGDLTDYSPDGCAARAELARETLTALAEARVEEHRDEIAAEVMRERLGLREELHRSGDWLRPLRPLNSPMQGTLLVFSLMPTGDEADWQTIATRLEKVPSTLAGLVVSLEEGLSRSVLAARRQALVCAQQAREWSGSPGGHGFFSRLVGGYTGSDDRLRARLSVLAIDAERAYAELAHFLTDRYAPFAEEREAVGRERYELACREFTGATLDLDETYRWGWEELHRLEQEMTETAALILPGEHLGAVMDHLESDPTRMIEGEEAFRQWNQNLLDGTVAALDGRYFDLAPPVRRVEAMIAPPGGAAAMYYTGPSADFTRPGRTWYPTLGRTRFPLWMEPSVAYHEGVPGHHLQIATITYLGTRINAFQRRLGSISGYTEGWALYAERLMAELGFLEDPAYRLGMLANQAFRAARVVLDIGLHLELPIPNDESYHPGETWNAELAVPFLMAASGRPEPFVKSEIERYLGWPGQAISYKVGERVWLETRDAARRASGTDFDLKSFHARGFELGFVGLDQLRSELGGASQGSL